jgi:pimeloyl-ACP methyl ester carboxylesterase
MRHQIKSDGMRMNQFMNPGKNRSRVVSILLMAAALGIALVLGVGGWAYYAIAHYADPLHKRIVAAGYHAKTAQVNGIKLSYVEGPDNGPPLVLLHAQYLDWFSYSRVLPALSKSFHVYDIDYPGHGSTITPVDYPMTANRIGADLSDFIEQEIRQPVFVSGNSSGGLLTVWLAANRPAQVKAVLLEDPPLFSSEYPRIKQTVADKSFSKSSEAVEAHTDDFLWYWIDASKPFFTKNLGPGTAFLLEQAVKVYRYANPGRPAEIGLVSNDTVRMLLRGLDQYDPRFGAAFHDGSWNRGFSHAAALEKIACPTLLLQANTSILPNGLLDGAMSNEEAVRARALLKDGKFIKINATHVVNLDRPADFVGLAKQFFLNR